MKLTVMTFIPQTIIWPGFLGHFLEDNNHSLRSIACQTVDHIIPVAMTQSLPGLMTMGGMMLIRIALQM